MGDGCDSAGEEEEKEEEEEEEEEEDKRTRIDEENLRTTTGHTQANAACDEEKDPTDGQTHGHT